MKFKNLINKLLQEEEIKKTVRAFFVEGEPTKKTGILMRPLNSDKNPLPKFNFESDQTFDQFVKTRMKEELGLVENPSDEQSIEIINRKRKPKGKTVYFKDFIDKRFIDKRIENSDDLVEDIIDAEIVQEPLRVKVKNEEL